MKIGLLGGSFNPAHDGHFHISLQSLKQLQLDQIWWLVSPQNPLKSGDDMASYSKRVASARHFTNQHPALHLCEIEQENNLQYTADTLQFITQTHPHHQFVWLMGSDNLAQFHRWKDWRNILNTLPVCIVDRAPHSHAALRSPMALAYAKYRLPKRNILALSDAQPPRWSYLFIPRHRESATRLRNQFGEKAFLE